MRPSKRPRIIKGSVGCLLKLTKELIKWLLAETPQLLGARYCHPPPLLAAQTLWQKLTPQDASYSKALSPWQAPYSPRCSLIYELSAGWSRHQRLSLCTTDPHFRNRAVDLSGSNRYLSSRDRWLEMDHLHCDVGNFFVWQIFHRDTPANNKKNPTHTTHHLKFNYVDYLKRKKWIVWKRWQAGRPR